MSEYTKGPWIVNKNGDLVGGEGKRVVMYGFRASSCMCDPTNEQRANGRLAESAADLLEALKTLVQEEFRDDDDPILDRARIQARNAIAKAEGK